MRSKLRSACLLALALASGSAHALGLGQIQVKSAQGQPLLAEIPIISSDPSELVSLDAGLASPETFTRVGLEPPIGIVADLRFTVGSDPQGRPVIRITTAQPVTQPVLDFLVQVDWGQGRLVREYIANMAAPGAVEAGADVAVQAPTAEQPAVVERPAAAAAPSVTQSASPSRSTPAPAPVPAASTPQPDTYRVRSGDTLSKVAAEVAPPGVTPAQAMVGLLRANPDAFVAGDLNQLRRGSVLRVPGAAELEAVEAREAAALVRASAAQWRQARTQPQAAVQPVSDARPAAVAAAPAAGRLEIVPPGAGRQARGGTQSGIEAGGEGEMLRQELQQTKESLAVRDAEVQELKSRVAELEKLQNDQQKLIALQNSQLHAAQQRPAAPAPAQPAPQSSAVPWIVGGALVLAALLAAALGRRRARREPVFRAPADEPRPSIADAFALETAATPAPAPGPSVAVEPAETRPSWERGRAGRGAPRAAAASVAPAAVANAETDAGGEPTAVERLELAQAYLDLGDANNARRLLDEVIASDDATARGVAAKMLRDIG